MAKEPEYQPVVRNVNEVMWDELPGHHGGALSKLLVHPDTIGSRLLDHRISTYQPNAFVELHTHRHQEQVYHILDGEGLVHLGTRRQVVKKHDVVFVPPGVEHALYNTGLKDLTFLVITTPVIDEDPGSI